LVDSNQVMRLQQILDGFPLISRELAI
jgi:hypothetical protein